MTYNFEHNIDTPAAYSLNKIFTEIGKKGQKSYKYCSTLVREFKSILRELDSIENTRTRKLMIRLTKDKFIGNLESSTMSHPVMTHMRTILTAIHRDKIRSFSENSLAQ